MRYEKMHRREMFRARAIYLHLVCMRSGRRDECFNGDVWPEEEWCSRRRQRKGGGVASEAPMMTDCKRVGVFSRLGLVRTYCSGRGKKAFHHFPLPLPSFVDSLLRRHAARLLGRASERAPTRLSALSPTLARRRRGRARAAASAAAVGRRRSGRPFGFPDSGEKEDDDDAPLASDGRRTEGPTGGS